MSYSDFIRKRKHWRHLPELETKGLKGDTGSHQEKQDRAKIPQPNGDPSLLLLAKRHTSKQQWLGVSALRPPGPHLGMGHGNGTLRRRRTPAPSRSQWPHWWSYLIWPELLPNGLDGVPTLAEHGLEQPLLGFLTFSLGKGRTRSRFSSECSDVRGTEQCFDPPVTRPTKVPKSDSIQLLFCTT